MRYNNSDCTRDKHSFLPGMLYCNCGSVRSDQVLIEEKANEMKTEAGAIKMPTIIEAFKAPEIKASTKKKR